MPTRGADLIGAGKNGDKEKMAALQDTTCW